jgi:Na+-driven multidrug efflux pump
VVVLWGVFIPLSYGLVVVRETGVVTAWLGGAFCYLLMAAALLLRFLSGRWKQIDIFGDSAS